MKMPVIEIKPVKQSDIRFLYNQLKERDSKINISHRVMPSYAEHSRFVLSKPYSRWYIIFHNNKKIGNVYLTRLNEIGIFVLKSIKIKGIGNIVLKEVMKKNPRPRYLANVSPRNSKSSEFFKKKWV